MRHRFPHTFFKRECGRASGAAGWIGGIPFSPSFSVTRVKEAISTQRDGDSKCPCFSNNPLDRPFTAFCALSAVFKTVAPHWCGLAPSAKSGISGRKRKSFPFSLSVPTGDPRAARPPPRRPPRRPGQTPSFPLTLSHSPPSSLSSFLSDDV